MNRAARRATREGRRQRADHLRPEDQGFFSRRLVLIVGVLAVASIGVIGAMFASDRSEVATPSLSSLTRLSALNVDQITIQKGDDDLSINRTDAVWKVGTHDGNRFKIDLIWSLLGQIDQTQSIESDPDRHVEFGLTPDVGTTVSFWNDDAFIDSLIIGSFDEETGGTYFRHPSADEIAAIGFDLEGFFSPTEDDWRNDIIVNAAAVLVESLRFTYADETFTVSLKTEDAVDTEAEAEQEELQRQQAALNAAITGQPLPEDSTTAGAEETGQPTVRFIWVIETDSEERRANTDRVLELLQQLSPLFADEFADEEWERLVETDPTWSLEMSGTGLGSLAHLSFYERDDSEGYFVRRTGFEEVFVVSAETVEGLMKRPEELEALLDIEAAQ